MSSVKELNFMTLARSIICFSFLATSIFAQTSGRPARTPILISPEIVDGVVALTPPPPLDSAKMSKDLAEIFAIHRLANSQQIESANWDNKHENIWAIARVLSDKFTPESMPATAALWADVSNDQGIFVTAAKKYFQHPRPYDLDANIKSVCGSNPGGPKNSYPSGHGTVGYVAAILLTMMVPERATVLHARADEYAHNRVVCGDHYAADVMPSREGAYMIVGNMIGNPKFEQKFIAAKAEVRRALGM
jgi:acid phosphatase (class A)